MTRCKQSHTPVAVLLLALTFLLLSVGVAQAQSGRLVATIPFAFYTGDMLLPAGDYEVVRVTNGVLKISSRETNSAMFFQTVGVSRRALQQQEPGQLIFKKYGDDYLLSEMWWPYRSDGWKVVPSGFEHELAKNTSPLRVSISVR